MIIPDSKHVLLDKHRLDTSLETHILILLSILCRECKINMLRLLLIKDIFFRFISNIFNKQTKMLSFRTIPVAGFCSHQGGINTSSKNG